MTPKIDIGDTTLGILLAWLSIASTTLAVCLATIQIMKHLLYYNEPRLQIFIVRILLMIPVYSITSTLALFEPYSHHYLFLNTIRDCYEAYVLYIFMQLLIQYLGGQNMLVSYLELKRRIKHPWPFQNMAPVPTNKRFLRRVKQGALQFVLIKPITAILGLILQHYHLYKDGELSFTSGYFYCAFINNISVTISLYCLVYFYLATQERLAPYQPFLKFICIKAVIFFSFWQACFFVIITKAELLNSDQSTLLQNFLISIEMFFAAIAQTKAFSASEFSEGRNKQFKPILDRLSTVLNPKDVIKDAKNMFIESQEQDVVDMPIAIEEDEPQIELNDPNDYSSGSKKERSQELREKKKFIRKNLRSKELFRKLKQNPRKLDSHSKFV